MPFGRGSNCWLTKMDGVIMAVVHDEFRAMGLSGVQERCV
jgi:ribose 5-phosphate isomerase RpiB